MSSVSVVVPIFNKEKYVCECVDSLLSQSLDDLEIILVDDGSTDSSGMIADGYALAHNNIVVIHQNNAGLGPARNSGIDAANGEYVAFVDADDWVEPCMYENLYKDAISKNADIVVSGHCDVTNGEKTYVKTHPLAGKVLHGHEAIEPYRLNLYGHSLNDPVVESFPMSVCMSLYRRQMLREGSLKFKEILSEDIFFNLGAYAAANTISFLADVNYCYRKEQQDSITHTFSPEKLGRYTDFIKTLMSAAESEPHALREDCIMRARRTALDYARLYFTLIVQSDSSFSCQKQYGLDFIESSFFRNYCLGFPVRTLPVQQRFFQAQLENGKVSCALLMTKARLALKKGQR